jgi:hypothetical protein
MRRFFVEKFMEGKHALVGKIVHNLGAAHSDGNRTRNPNRLPDNEMSRRAPERKKWEDYRGG